MPDTSNSEFQIHDAAKVSPSTGNTKRPLVWVRVLIITATLAAVAITMLLGSRTYQQTKILATDSFNHQQLILAQSAARGVESYFKELSVGLKSLARVPQFQQMDPQCMQCMEHTYWGFPTRTSLRLLDKDGMLRFIYPDHNWRKELIGRNYSKEAYFQEVAQNGRTGVHVVANERGEARIRIAVAVYSTPRTETIKGTGVTTTQPSHSEPESGRFCGVLIGSLDPHMIDQNLIRPIVSGKTGYAWLLDDRGVFLSHYEKDFVGRNALEARVERDPDISHEAINQIQRKMLAGQEGIGRYFSGRHRGEEGQIEKLIAYTPVRVDKKVWSVAVCAPVSEVEEVIRAAKRFEIYTLGFVILALTAGGLSFFTISYRWSRSLERQVRDRTRELKETSDYLSRLIRYANAPIIVWNPDRKITIFNKAFEKMSGRSEVDVLGSPLDVLFPPQSRGESLEKIEVSKTQYWENVEILILHKDGQVRVGFWNSANIYAEDGKTLVATVAQGQDITERKQVEESLRKSEERFRAIFETAKDSIFIKDRMLTYTQVNPAMERLFDLPASELIGKTDEELFGKEAEVHMREVDSRVLAGEVVEEDNTKPVHGVMRTFRVVKVPMRDDSGKIIGLCGMAHDITERKQAEREKEMLEEQLRQAVKMEAIGRLAGGIAHDFNNMLAIIQGYADLLLKAMDAADRNRDDVERIRDAARRAAALTRQLLAFGRKQTIQPHVLNLNEVIAEADSMLQRTIGEDVELVTIPGEDLWHVKADPMQIEQVILNLAVNAREAMPDGGKLTIETANVTLDENYARRHAEVTPGKYVMLAVSDTGAGMTEEVMAHIFEPFFTTKEAGRGTGLGLSTTYGIVKQNGGHIWIYSEPGRGTTFRIYLPQVEGSVEAIARQYESAPLLGGTETVLVVEDESSVLALTCRILREQGYTVLEASDGEKALLVAGEHTAGEIHLLITDVVMPHISGKELSGRLKAIRPDIKVLYISGYTDNAIVHHGILDERVNFLAKPFTSRQLIRTVRRILDVNA